MTSTYDVVIVGGRVAGAATALLLARAGVRVALVDRGDYGTDTISTHGLMRAGVMQLSRWEILDEVIAAGTPPIRETTFHYADGESTHVSIRPSAGVDALYAPRRYLLDRILVDAAADAGADVWHGTTVTDALCDGARVVGVRTVDRSGRPGDLRGTITVGADGVRSTLARLVDAPVVRAGRNRSAILYRYLADVDATGYEWAYGRRAGAGLIPTNDGLTCVFVGTDRESLRRLLPDHGRSGAFRALLRQAGPRLSERVAAATPTGRMYGWSGPPGFVRRSWGPGWALVGDAGYFKDPLTTHGITDALRDAELLADALLEVLAGVTPEPVALARYQATRDRLSRRLLEATEAVASYEWSLSQVRDLLRAVSSAMSDEVDHLAALPKRRSTPVPTTIEDRRS